MTRRLVAVSGGLSVPSTSRVLADQLGTATVQALRQRGHQAEVQVLELRPLARPLADHLLTGFPAGGLEAALDAVARADGLIMVSPVYAASYSGLFKSFVDVLEPGSVRGRPVLLAATGGTGRHSLVVEHALRPLFAHLGALTVPTGVFAATEDFGGLGRNGGERGSSSGAGGLAERVDRAGGELADLVAARPRLHAVPAPRDPLSDVADFDDVPDFETLLRLG